MANEEDAKNSEEKAAPVAEAVQKTEKTAKAAEPVSKETDAKEAPAKAESKTAPAKAEGKEEGAKVEKKAEPAAAEPAVARKVRTKGGRHVPVGVVHVKATFNNTQVTITDPTGAVVSWSNAGRCGFKGSRKSTAFAATTVAQEATRGAQNFGMHEVEIEVQGPGAGRESAIRAVQAAGMMVSAIRDVTPIPHNGCRAPKRRRV